MALYRKKNIVKKGRSVAEIILLQPFLNIFNEKKYNFVQFLQFISQKKKGKWFCISNSKKIYQIFFLNPNKNKSHLSFQVNSKFKKKLHIF